MRFVRMFQRASHLIKVRQQTRAGISGGKLFIWSRNKKSVMSFACLRNKRSEPGLRASRRVATKRKQRYRAAVIDAVPLRVAYRRKSL